MPITKLQNGHRVETWRDPQPRNYVTPLVDAEGHEVAHPLTGNTSEHTGTQVRAKAAHEAWVSAGRKAGL